MPNQILARDGMYILKYGHGRAQQMLCVCVCTCVQYVCVSTGNHRAQEHEGRAGLVTERPDLPSMRILDRCMGKSLF